MVEWTDFAIEVPGLFYYMPSDSDCPPKLSVKQFFPSCHAHSGGTWRWRGPRPGPKRDEMRTANPRSAQAQRQRKSLRQIANEGVREGNITLPDVLYLVAQLVYDVKAYHAAHHNSACILGNQIAMTVGGVQHQLAQIREAAAEVASMIKQHSRHDAAAGTSTAQTDPLGDISTAAPP